MAEKVVIGNAELWHGDCREVLPLLPKHDLLLTDPPYGIGFGAKHTKWSANRDVHLGNWDEEIPDIEPILECAGDAIVWGGERFALPIRRRWLTWVKPDAAPTFASTEFAWTSQDKPARHYVYAVGAVNQERVGHPTQKPLALMLWCLGFVPASRTVLDPFMGSGTTGVACAQLGKAFTGIERERKYFDIACERIARAQAQGTLLPPEEPRQPVQEGLL